MSFLLFVYVFNINMHIIIYMAGVRVVHVCAHTCIII